ncbi:MAG: helicase, partial [Edaphobacter sp.]
MKLLRNSGSDRVVDAIRGHSSSELSLDYVSRGFSLPAFGEIAQFLNELTVCRLILQEIPASELGVCGSDIDRAARNKLNLRWLAMRCIKWAELRVDFRGVPKAPPQSALVIRRDGSDAADKSISGNCPFTTEGFGLAPGDRMSLIQCSDTPEEA